MAELVAILLERSAGHSSTVQYEILDAATSLVLQNVEVVLEFVPAHVGLRGNECLD